MISHSYIYIRPLVHRFCVTAHENHRCLFECVIFESVWAIRRVEQCWRVWVSRSNVSADLVLWLPAPEPAEHSVPPFHFWAFYTDGERSASMVRRSFLEQRAISDNSAWRWKSFVGRKCGPVCYRTALQRHICILDWILRGKKVLEWCKK